MVLKLKYSLVNIHLSIYIQSLYRKYFTRYNLLLYLHQTQMNLL